MTLSAAPRIAKLLPRLASSHDAEVVATARAIERTLKASGQDWHDLAREIGHPAPATVISAHRARRPRREWTPRTAPLDPEALRLLQAGLALDAFTPWERGFAETTITASRRRGWHPTKKQTDVIARLVSKAQEAEAHP